MLSRYYDFTKRLHTADSSVIYLAVDKASGAAVCVKICKDYNPKSDPKEVRLLTVAQRNERVCGIIGWHALAHTHSHAVVMEYVPHAHMDAQLFGRPSRIRVYMRDMLEGLAHLHSRNILYRDIKPR